MERLPRFALSVDHFDGGVTIQPPTAARLAGSFPQRLRKINASCPKNQHKRKTAAFSRQTAAVCPVFTDLGRKMASDKKLSLFLSHPRECFVRRTRNSGRCLVLAKGCFDV
jgi:hypothetical protein